jgi:hypothetical protein
VALAAVDRARYPIKVLVNWSGEGVQLSAGTPEENDGGKDEARVG